MYTVNELIKVCPSGREKYLDVLVKSDFIKSNTNRVINHFLAQCAHETGGFKWFTELGNQAYFKKYDYRSDIGNQGVGDGYKYRGRGYIMLTGKANYKFYSPKVGKDLVEDPDWVSTPEGAVATAVAFWNDHKELTKLALRDNIESVTKIINGGNRGLLERKRYYTKFKEIFGDD